MGQESLQMRTNCSPDKEADLRNRILKPQSRTGCLQSLLAGERIREVMLMCDRENPIYEQISSFSIALYTIGYIDCADLMSFQDIEQHEAAEILCEDFVQTEFNEVPTDYIITESLEKYLLVLGDPLFPEHFAVITSARGARPYFSKLPFFGSGFDSLAELKTEFAGPDGVADDEIHCFRELRPPQPPPAAMGKIYIVKED